MDFERVLKEFREVVVRRLKAQTLMPLGKREPFKCE